MSTQRTGDNSKVEHVENDENPDDGLASVFGALCEDGSSSCSIALVVLTPREKKADPSRDGS